ncbi:MAG TPA: tRNA (adenosine(37)-N6)-dimethylallyltransferase MiaA [Thermoanaerobaculia bacterium]|nr:tRNA (adenosine(37)-N6)-dimethylallyltransferase MiaA [Thermoanaerobaculia bacterium]
MRAPRGVLAVVGATATGKSALAVEVALRLGGEIISADAFTAYRGIDAGTAKPTIEERRGVPHHLVDIKEPADPFSAGEFARLARAASFEILSRGKLPILCGGTGFYVRAFFEGLFVGPPRDERLRGALRGLQERHGAPWLVRALGVIDPESGARISQRDGARAIRYLEIAFSTGRRPSDLFRERPGERWEGPAVRVVLTLPRPILYGRIERRFRESIMTRLPDEVRRLLEVGVPSTAPAMAAIGYRQTVEFVEGRMTADEWMETVVGQTRRYAKRQETWFRSEPDLLFFRAHTPGLVDEVVAASGPLFS